MLHLRSRSHIIAAMLSQCFRGRMLDFPRLGAWLGSFLFRNPTTVWKASPGRSFWPILIVAAIACGEVQAQQSVTLAWDPPAPGADVAGYTIYYGPAAGVYTNSLKVGNVFQATVSGLTEGAVYYFTVTDYNQAGLESRPSNEIVYTVPTRCVTFPGIEAAAALVQDPETAVLNGAVNPNGWETLVWVEYGFDTNYGFLTLSTNIGSGTNPVSIAIVLAGLLPAQTYDFRWVAANLQGTNYGLLSSFTTLPEPEPAAPTLALASVAVTQTNLVTGTRMVELSGTVNPNGLDTEVRGQYGLALDFAEVGPLAYPAERQEAQVRLGLSGLVPGASYWFRLVATNAAGSAASECLSFAIPSQFILGDANGDGVVDQGELSLVLSNYFHSGSATNAAGLPATSPPSNTTAVVFSVLASTNLLDWISLPGRGEFWDLLDPTNVTPRFYRLRWP